MTLISKFDNERDGSIMADRYPIIPLILVTFIMFSSLTLLQADTIHFSGTVLDESDHAVAGAKACLFTRNAIMAFTNNNGNFELTGNSDLTSAIRPIPSKKGIDINRSVRYQELLSGVPLNICIYDINGRKITRKEIESGSNAKIITDILLSDQVSGVFVVVANYGGYKQVIRYIVSGNSVHSGICSVQGSTQNAAPSERAQAQTSVFQDILTVSADGAQTVRRAVTSMVEKEIKIKLMPSGVGYVTAGIPIFSEKGGTGDVTTYGSVSNPEFSHGGACNYGSTGIRYYAAINVNQFPGDANGQWNDGQICGRCARIRILTKEGEERTTIVRIMDKCPDDNCGIDLGGAPAGVIMKTQPGRFAGEWEWVSCDGVEVVSDGPPTLNVKEGSNEWWSLVQARNGPGAVKEMRVRKTGTTNWQVLEWANEAENFLRLPETLLKDCEEWEVEVIWTTGPKGTLHLPGNKLSIANSSYQLSF